MPLQVLNEGSESHLQYLNVVHQGSWLHPHLGFGHIRDSEQRKLTAPYLAIVAAPHTGNKRVPLLHPILL